MITVGGRDGQVRACRGPHVDCSTSPANQRRDETCTMLLWLGVILRALPMRGGVSCLGPSIETSLAVQHFHSVISLLTYGLRMRACDISRPVLYPDPGGLHVLPAKLSLSVSSIHSHLLRIRCMQCASCRRNSFKATRDMRVDDTSSVTSWRHTHRLTDYLVSLHHCEI